MEEYNEQVYEDIYLEIEGNPEKCFSHKPKDGKSYINCWYFKINERIKLQVEADKDRKNIIRLLLEQRGQKNKKGDQREKTNFSDKKF